MRPDPFALVDALALNTGVSVPAPADPLGAGVPAVPTVDERLAALRMAITDQETPIGPPMRNRPIALKVFAHETRLDLLETLTQQLLNGASATDAEVKATVARLDLLRIALATSNAQQAADEVRLAAVEAKATLTASATEANRLDIIALKAADVLLQAQDAKDATAIAAAQATATQARSEAATAQKKAEDDAAAVLALQAQLATVQATANAAQVSAAANATALAGKLDASAVQRFTTPTPQITVAVGAPATFNVVLPKPFATNQYLVFFTKASGAALLNVQLSDTAKLPGSFTATMQQTGLASLAVAPSSAEVLAILIS